MPKDVVISGPYFPVFGLNTEIYFVILRIQSKFRKIRTRNNCVFGHFSHSASVWVKKDNSDFDLTEGSYNGAEVCELVGLYLLNLLTDEFGKHNTGLHRDGSLSCFQNISNPDSEKIKKKCVKD